MRENLYCKFQLDDRFLYVMKTHVISDKLKVFELHEYDTFKYKSVPRLWYFTYDSKSTNKLVHYTGFKTMYPKQSRYFKFRSANVHRQIISEIRFQKNFEKNCIY